MRLLVLGGTAFLGRHVVEHALARGDDVTLFNRGRSAPGLFGDAVEELRGDRGGELGALRDGTWDAAIDLSGYVPGEVQASSRLLAERVEHLTFVSSISAYASLSAAGIDEVAPLASGGEDYGALKAACERVAQAAFSPRSCLVVRPGIIAGPGDPTNRFSWWVARLARGGRVLAPQPPERGIQLIDARDLAAWILDMASRREGGCFNAVGRRHTMQELLDACRTGVPAEIVWVGEDELLAAGVEPWSQLPLWIASSETALAGFFAVDGSKAFAAGLRPRPLADTARDTLAALRHDGEPSAGGRTRREPGLDPAIETRLIAGR
jgi:2'-hydroxyisoflavone reductase